MYSVRSTHPEDKGLFLECAQATCHRAFDVDALAIGWDRYWSLQVHPECRLSFVLSDRTGDVGVASISIVHPQLFDKIAAINNLQDYFSLSYLSEMDYLSEPELAQANSARSVVAYVDAMVWLKPHNFMPLIDSAVRAVKGLHISSLLFAPLKPQLDTVLPVFWENVSFHFGLGGVYARAKMQRRVKHKRNRYFVTVQLDRDPRREMYGNPVERVFEPFPRPEGLEEFNLPLRMRRYLQSMQPIRDDKTCLSILGVRTQSLRKALSKFEPADWEESTPFTEQYRTLIDPNEHNVYARFESLRERHPSLKFPVAVSR